VEACRRAPLFPWPAVVARGDLSGSVDLYFFVGAGAVLASVGFLSCLLKRTRRSPCLAVSEPAAAVSPGAPLQRLLAVPPSSRWTKWQ
jgi:hypothetical protein